VWEVYTAQPAYRKLLDAAHLYEAIVLQNLRPKIPSGACGVFVAAARRLAGRGFGYA
jgi:hypothetical protein